MSFAYTLTGPIGGRATLGLIALQADETIEHDFRRLLPVDDVALYVSRVPSGLEVTGDTLAAMSQDLPSAAALFPRSVAFDVVGYGCTSGTSVIGTGRVAALVHHGCKTRQVTEPLSALVAACGHLGVSKLAFLSPYIASVSSSLRDALADAGIECPKFGSFDEAEEARVARIDPQSIAAAAIELGGAQDAEAVFLSCTNLRTLDVLSQIEAELGKPVLSSNQVLAWDIARRAGIALNAGTDMGCLLAGRNRP